jgi:murein DD-endopeptidase MepM/ murein hydrolase activator NlpD
MQIRRIFLGVLITALTLTSANARGHRGSKYHYANNVKVEDEVKKFHNFENKENTYPAELLYGSTWSNSTLNPYDIALPDSFKIVVSDFYPPIIPRHIASGYGPRWGRFHAGIDLALRQGDSVRAAFDGQVRIAHKFNKGGYGWYVVIRHDNGLETLYGHLSRPLVYNDQRVRAGEVIGLGGSTGHSTGPHLHFETRFLGVPMDPRNIIDFRNLVIYSDTYTVNKNTSFRAWNQYHHIYYISDRAARHMRYAARHHRNRHHNEAADTADNQMVAAAAPIQQSKKEDLSSDSTQKAAKIVEYTIRRGDSIYKIARNNNTTVQSICQLNGIKSRAKLRVGQVIKVSQD